ncbi:MAG: hypothetical protein IJ763_10905 [Lachnospiraceae bacterium]|nr:hypothetical protein [Lachnospiraceae bacterium]MBR1817187.1 hypothetical protein [Lachnospiraceae bacterium]
MDNNSNVNPQEYYQSNDETSPKKKGKKGLIITISLIVILAITACIILFAGGIFYIGTYNFYSIEYNNPNFAYNSGENKLDYKLKVGLFGKSQFTMQGETYDCNVDFDNDNITINVNNESIKATYDKSDKSIAISSDYLPVDTSQAYIGDYKFDSMIYYYQGEALTVTASDIGATGEEYMLSIGMDGVSTLTTDQETYEYNVTIDGDKITIKSTDGVLWATYNEDDRTISLSLIELADSIDTGYTEDYDISFLDLFDDIVMILKDDGKTDTSYNLILKK